MTFNYYDADIKKSIPLGQVTLPYLISAIRSPKKDMRDIFEAISEAEERHDMATKAALKTRLYSFTPCVFVKGPRRYSNIVNWTGLVVLDFDHLPKPYCAEFRDAIFNEYSCVTATWLSASKHGVRALLTIPICNSVTEFKEYYAAIEQEFSIYTGYDRAPKNCILPMFISYDPDIKYRAETTIWQRKHIAIPATPVPQYIVTDKTSTIEKIMVSAISKIHDNGHPQLRAAAFSLGGYVGAGYLDQSTATTILTNLIRSNAYLQQKPDVYIATAKQMIQKGLTQPLHLTV